MRIGVGGCFHESHGFAARLTPLSDFDLVRGKHFVEEYAGTRTSMAGFLDAAPRAWEVVPLLYATATASGPLERRAYEAIRGELAERVAAARLNGLFLILHGAMCVDGMTDAEADLLRTVRRALPNGAPLVVTIDLHANVSPQVAALADAIVGYKTYPHVDAYERAVDATRILVRMLQDDVRPAVSLAKPRLIMPVQAGETDRQPMKDLMALAAEVESRPHVLNVSVVPGFPYADEERVGTSILVTTDNRPDLGAQYADELAQVLWMRRDELRIRNHTPEEAVAMALATEAGPVVLADVADNVGAGSSADGTAILAELLRRGVPSALVTINDPEAVERAFEAGLGGGFSGLIGGKTDDFHGEPVFVEGEVIRLLADGRIRYHGPYMPGQPHDMGRTAVVRTGGVDIVLTSNRTPPFDRAYLTALHLDPVTYRIIVAKSAVAWQAAFGSLARQAIAVDAPGITTARIETLRYRNVRRPVFPLDDI